MAFYADIQFKNVSMDIFIKGQVAIEKISAVQKYVDETGYVDNEVIFGILGIKKEAQREAGDDVSIPL